MAWGRHVKTELAPDARPCLAPGTRLHWDHLRQRHVLLVPEGLLVVNATGAAILELCDGKRSIASIATELSKRFRHVVPAEIQEEIVAFLDRLASKRLVVCNVPER
jgi:pyrroloquinoline quinone biosynthesis protein D